MLTEFPRGPCRSLASTVRASWVHVQNAGIPTMARQRPKTTVLGLFIHLRNRSSLELPACMAPCCISMPYPSNEVSVSGLLDLLKLDLRHALFAEAEFFGGAASDAQ